ncbi:MAG: hypothetical protein QW483_01590 [Nanopusillaceae archaeon]
MQSLSRCNKSLEDILNEIIVQKIAVGHINFKEHLDISASTLSTILYFLETRDLESFNLYFLRNFKFENEKLFKKVIPENICKMLYCRINDQVFLKDLYIENFGYIKIFAKPDAFFGDLPIEIKSISLKMLNGGKYKFLERYGRYQAEMYGYILNKDTAYLIMIIYNNNLKIINYKVIKIDLNLEKINKRIVDALKDVVLPMLKKIHFAAGGI